MNCDNCGRSCRSTESNEFVEWRLQRSWPFINRVIVQEMWCRACSYANTNMNNRVAPRLRRKLDFDDDHPHKD